MHTDRAGLTLSINDLLWTFARALRQAARRSQPRTAGTNRGSANTRRRSMPWSASRAALTFKSAVSVIGLPKARNPAHAGKRAARRESGGPLQDAAGDDPWRKGRGDILVMARNLAGVPVSNAMGCSTSLRPGHWMSSRAGGPALGGGSCRQQPARRHDGQAIDWLAMRFRRRRLVQSRRGSAPADGPSRSQAGQERPLQQAAGSAPRQTWRGARSYPPDQFNNDTKEYRC